MGMCPKNGKVTRRAYRSQCLLPLCVGIFDFLIVQKRNGYLLICKLNFYNYEYFVNVFLFFKKSFRKNESVFLKYSPSRLECKHDYDFIFGFSNKNGNKYTKCIKNDLNNILTNHAS